MIMCVWCVWVHRRVCICVCKKYVQYVYADMYVCSHLWYINAYDNKGALWRPNNHYNNRTGAVDLWKCLSGGFA